MFQKEDCYRLGSVVKLHGFKGALSIYLDVEDPQEYENLESVFLDYHGKLVPFFLESIQVRNNGYAVAKFEDVDDEDAAKVILKCGIFLPLDDLEELGEDEFYYFEVEGFKVVDINRGEIGIVKRILDLSGNPLFEIDFNGLEILIPRKDEFIDRIDREEETVYLNAPEELLDMYLNPEE
ncbi:MAG: ribosome maturation factor RimM [Crocinitomicaceae bacterium]|nr:ribosome maturation factor RimM [Crocinitomicaceae bacterium]